ncbi:Abi family protein [Campylobacter fetus]|uniref:Abi family protein n=1 Tax=Campylobacter fetus TaxID=196 RepID=UPI001F4C6133|nr:Abi family protein [Campylobacter fetus]
MNRYDKKVYSVYSKSLLDKYRSKMPIWVLVEILDFGELILFYKFYEKSYSIEKVSTFDLYAIKSLRNVAAHNSCVLHTLTIHPIKMKISTTLKQILRNKKILSRKEKEVKIPLRYYI